MVWSSRWFLAAKLSLLGSRPLRRACAARRHAAPRHATPHVQALSFEPEPFIYMAVWILLGSLHARTHAATRSHVRHARTE